MARAFARPTGRDASASRAVAASRYAIYCLPEGECLPQTLLVPMRASGVRLVADGRPLACEAADGGTRVFLPADVAGSAPLALALCMGEGEF